MEDHGTANTKHVDLISRSDLRKLHFNYDNLPADTEDKRYSYVILSETGLRSAASEDPEMPAYLPVIKVLDMDCDRDWETGLHV